MFCLYWKAFSSFCLFVCSLCLICIDLWISFYSSWLKYTVIIIYFITQIVPHLACRSSCTWGPVSFWHILNIFLSTFLLPDTKKNNNGLGSSGTFMLTLESAISPFSECWCSNYFWSVIAFRPHWSTKVQSIFTSLCLYFSIYIYNYMYKKQWVQLPFSTTGFSPTLSHFIMVSSFSIFKKLSSQTSHICSFALSHTTRKEAIANQYHWEKQIYSVELRCLQFSCIFRLRIYH